jgi:hypothetical protein
MTDIPYEAWKMYTAQEKADWEWMVRECYRRGDKIEGLEREAKGLVENIVKMLDETVHPEVVDPDDEYVYGFYAAVEMIRERMSLALGGSQ